MQNGLAKLRAARLATVRLPLYRGYSHFAPGCRITSFLEHHAPKRTYRVQKAQFIPSLRFPTHPSGLRTIYSVDRSRRHVKPTYISGGLFMLQLPR